MDDYLTKPIDMEELELVLKRFAKPALKAGIV
jgi:YesN/AraC family two-component response regulator